MWTTHVVFNHAYYIENPRVILHHHYFQNCPPVSATSSVISSWIRFSATIQVVLLQCYGAGQHVTAAVQMRFVDEFRERQALVDGHRNRLVRRYVSQPALNVLESALRRDHFAHFEVEYEHLHVQRKLRAAFVVRLKEIKHILSLSTYFLLTTRNTLLTVACIIRCHVSSS